MRQHRRTSRQCRDEPLTPIRRVLALCAAAAISAGCGASANTGGTTTTKVTTTTNPSAITTTTTTITTTTTTTTTTTQATSDDQIAAAAKQYLLTGWFLQPPDGDFKNVDCNVAAACWAPYIDGITFSGGVLYLHMDTDWKYQPDAALMMMAQNRVAAVLQFGRSPAIVMDNVRSVQAVDISGETTSSGTPLHR
jgi:hypothetical protein